LPRMVVYAHYRLIVTTAWLHEKPDLLFLSLSGGRRRYKLTFSVNFTTSLAMPVIATYVT